VREQEEYCGELLITKRGVNSSENLFQQKGKEMCNFASPRGKKKEKKAGMRGLVAQKGTTSFLACRKGSKLRLYESAERKKEELCREGVVMVSGTVGRLTS